MTRVMQNSMHMTLKGIRFAVLKISWQTIWKMHFGKICLKKYKHRWRWPLWSPKTSSSSGKHNKIPQNSVFTISHESLGMRKLFSRWVPRLLTLDKNNNMSTIQSAVWTCSSEVKRIFRVGMWPWMKHGSTTTHLEQKKSSAEWTAASESRPKRSKT